jgi:flagellar M-ring protein FliF
VNPEQLLTHLKTLGTALSAKQLLGLGAVFVAVLTVIVGSAYWINQSDYALLLTDMDGETASSVVDKLESSRVPYRLGDGGRSISVPVEHLDELRLELGSGGLPSGGRLGFEIFDRPAFGTTEFLEHVNYRRALEGELARTISTLSEVSSVRVHISMAKDSLFVTQERPAKASVVLRLKSGRPLAPATVKGIAGLVAASVESLRPEQVTILDTNGRFLSRAADETGAGVNSLHFERQQQIERDLAARVVALLDPVVGAGRVRVNVSALLNTDLVEQTEERFDPNGIVRSQQTTSESSAAPVAAGGVAGARANQPAALSTSTATAPAAAPAPDTPAANVNAAVAVLSGTGRSSAITNYEVNKVTRHTVTGQGQVSRLSVAVIVDDERVTGPDATGSAAVTTRPWEPAALQRLHGVVAAAVGLDPERGDQLTIENISFEATAPAPEAPPPGVGTQALDLVKQHWPAALRVVAVVLVASFAIFGVLRPLARRATALAAAPALPAPVPAAARLPTVSELEGQIDGGEGASGTRRLPALTRRVAKLASEEPELLARIVRGWMAEDGRS